MSPKVMAWCYGWPVVLSILNDKYFNRLNATYNRIAGQRDLVKIVSYQQMLIEIVRYIKQVQP